MPCHATSGSLRKHSYDYQTRKCRRCGLEMPKKHSLRAGGNGIYLKEVTK